jgi:hypothetical protein
MSIGSDLVEAWERLRPAFEPDGALRDLYVLGTDEQEWDVLVAKLRNGDWKLEFSINGILARVPTHTAELFAFRATASPLLVIDPDDLHLNTPLLHADGDRM